MKRFIACIIVLLLCGSTLHAQPWMPKDKKGPFRLQDIITSYKGGSVSPLKEEEDEEQVKGKPIKEGKDYLFDRWAWFWKEHLDVNGYMVSPVKTLTEWQKYLATHTARSSAQRTTSTPSDWVFQGPDQSGGGYSGLGRINVVAFHPTDTNTVYAGTAGGGTWKTTDDSVTWTALYANLPTMGVSDIKINPLNPNTIYVCTGDADGYDNYSEGIIKSTDGGLTWTNTGLSWTPTEYIYARSLLINPLDTNSLTLATNNGIYKTFDGGATWTNIPAGDFKQILFCPVDTNIMYGTNYTSTSSQILRSHDGGNTWATVTSLTDADRINIAVCPSSPQTVMALASSSNQDGLEGVYSSSDSGATYTEVFTEDIGCTMNIIGYDLGLPTTACNGQGWYDLCIAIDPLNVNNVIVGGINNYYSTDGGLSWSIVTQWYTGIPGIQTVHADKHSLAYNPLNHALYEGCDGGIYKTMDATGGIWEDHTNGMGITQFYRNAVATGVTFCLGGAQDNGTKSVDVGGAYADVTGGDGMVCQIDYTNPSFTWYTSYPNGSFDVTNDGGISYTNISSNIPGTPSGDWVTPYIIHPNVPSTLLAGYGQLFMSADQGSTWAAISPAFDTPYYNINTIAVPFTNPNDIYLAVDDNHIHFSPDFGATWSNINLPSPANISRFAVDPKNENIIWVTFNGYGANKVAEYNRSTNTWTIHNGTLPDIPVNCIVIDSSSETKYIGTDVAVYYMDTTMTDWALFDTHLPAVIVNDLNINYSTNELWAATFGRGMWKTLKSDIPTSVSSVIPYAIDVIKISPNPNKGTFTINTGNTALIGKQAQVQLLAADGKTAWQGNNTFDNTGNMKVVTNGLAKGTYICEVSNSEVVARSRLVIY